MARRTLLPIVRSFFADHNSRNLIPVASARQREKRKMARAALRILVIDDDEGITDSIARLLCTRGHAVTMVNDASRALEHLESSAFDLVITDIIMFGTDGIETIQVIRRQFPSMPVIAMSGGGCGFLGCLKTARMLGANETLEKPFEDGALFETIDRALAGH